MSDMLVGFGPFAVDCVKSTLRHDGREVTTLTGMERRFLICLFQAKGGRVDMDQLYTALWGEDPDGGPSNPVSNLRVLVHRLREKMRRNNLPYAIVSMRTEKLAHDPGYRFAA